jgi:hypothetical protein
MGKRPDIGNRDLNEADLLSAIHKLGVFTQMMPGYIGYDCLWFFRGETFIVEIKNPDRLPASGNILDMLTENEQATKLLLETVGIPYNIILTIDDALHLLGID